MESAVKISVTANGKAFSVPAEQPLSEFLKNLGFEPGMVVVERNREPVSPSEAGSVRLAEGDSLEIVRIVAGG